VVKLARTVPVFDRQFRQPFLGHLLAQLEFLAGEVFFFVFAWFHRHTFPWMHSGIVKGTSL
jgi:hypothetical protein